MVQPYHPAYQPHIYIMLLSIDIECHRLSQYELPWEGLECVCGKHPQAPGPLGPEFTGANQRFFYQMMKICTYRYRILCFL